VSLFVKKTSKPEAIVDEENDKLSAKEPLKEDEI